MNRSAIHELRDAIRLAHGCDARWVMSVAVREPYWSGEVQVFQLVGHPSADRCYAWSQLIGPERRAHAVLNGATVQSAAEAVRATIMARERTRVL
jgi:hypothetical protein